MGKWIDAAVFIRFICAYTWANRTRQIWCVEAFERRVWDVVGHLNEGVGFGVKSYTL